MKHTFAEDIGWGDASVIGGTLTALHHEAVTRIELATNQATPLPTERYGYASDALSAVIGQDDANSKLGDFLEVHERGEPPRRLPDEVSTFALDPGGKLAFVSHVGKMRVYELPAAARSYARPEVPYVRLSIEGDDELATFLRARGAELLHVLLELGGSLGG